jgi:transcriptional regulator NrdR family protein
MKKRQADKGKKSLRRIKTREQKALRRLRRRKRINTNIRRFTTFENTYK